jgi:hypothetical protein
MIKKGALAQSVGFTVVSKAASLCKLSWVVGSHAAFFSAANMWTPLAGAFGGAQVATGSFIIALAARTLVYGALSLHALAYHIPGYCASLYWSSSSRVARALFPLAAMMLFWLNPVGAQAWGYALLWLIPLSIALVKRPTVWITALGSTFTAHAAGTIIWLYSMPLVPMAWYGLMPLVMVERVLFATGLFIMYHVVHYGIAHIRGGTRMHAYKAAIN